MGKNKMNDPGFQAILDQCAKVYPDQDGKFYGTIVSYRLGGNDPLDNVAVFKSEDGIPNWHYVTFGLTELYEKESEDKEYSGFGFELTFRLERKEEEPPMWPISLLQNLARYVFQTGNVFEAHQHMDINGPIALSEKTKLVALGFDTDPQFGSMDTPNGHVDFIQVIALTMDEMDSMMLWNGEKFLSLYRRFDPVGIAVLSRDSLLDNAEFKAELDKGIEQDGSSTGLLYTNDVYMEIGEVKGMKIAVLTIGAGHVKKITSMISARLSKGRKLLLKSRDLSVAFEPSEKPGFGKQEDFGIFYLTPSAIKEISSVAPHVGKTAMKCMPMLICVEKTEIRDCQGNVIETIE